MTPARELRFAFVFDDYDAALRLFRDVLGLDTVLDLDHEGGRGVILKVPSARLPRKSRGPGPHPWPTPSSLPGETSITGSSRATACS